LIVCHQLSELVFDRVCRGKTDFMSKPNLVHLASCANRVDLSQSESESDALRLDFDLRFKLQFRGSNLTTGVGPRPLREPVMLSVNRGLSVSSPPCAADDAHLWAPIVTILAAPIEPRLSKIAHFTALRMTVARISGTVLRIFNRIS
jgi:hypothetical protein